MRRLTSREKRLAWVTTSVVALAGYWTLVIEPQVTRGDALARRVTELETALARMQGNLLLRDRIEHRYAEVREAIRHVGTTEQEIAGFAQRLEELYRPLQVQVTGVRAMPVQDEGFYRTLVLRLEVEGRVPDVVALLAAVAGASEPMRTDRVELLCRERPNTVTATLRITQIIAPAEPGTDRLGAPIPGIRAKERT